MTNRKETITFRVDESDVAALREQGINAGPYIRKLIKMLIAKEKLPKQLEIEGDTKWKLVRVKIRT